MYSSAFFFVRMARYATDMYDAAKTHVRCYCVLCRVTRSVMPALGHCSTEIRTGTFLMANVPPDSNNGHTWLLMDLGSNATFITVQLSEYMVKVHISI